MSCNEWKEYTLDEVCISITDGSHSSPKSVENGYPMASVKDMGYFEINIDSCRQISEEDYQKLVNGKCKPEINDVLIAKDGSYMKFVNVVKEEKDLVLLSSIAILKPNIDILNPLFLKYYLLTPNVKHELEYGYVSGSAIRRIVLKDFKRFPIKLPPLEEQEKIADILSSLDDKIELNNEMNKTLEEMAQSIFKRWFVDFEFPNDEGQPYKSSGGEMVDSELGMIPKGWEVGKFRDYTDNVLGGDWGKESEQGNYTKEVFCMRGADIPEVRFGNKGSLPKRYILEKNHKNKKLNVGDIVVEISGGSPTQSTGRVTYINDLMLKKFDSDLVCTNFCRAITLKSPIYMEYFYFYWKYLYDNDVFFQYENGTTGIKNLDINSFLDKYQIVIPPEELIILFGKKIGMLMDKIQLNGEENIHLTSTRDTLLPKLMSGEIRVK